MRHKRCTKVGLDPHTQKKKMLVESFPQSPADISHLLWSNCKSLICRMSPFYWLVSSTRCFGNTNHQLCACKSMLNALAL